jgi:hypothetical protein
MEIINFDIRLNNLIYLKESLGFGREGVVVTSFIESAHQVFDCESIQGFSFIQNTRFISFYHS